MRGEILKNMTREKEIDKIVVNIGVGRLSTQPHFKDNVLPEIMKEAAIITGQKPAPRQTRKAIAGFKTRLGDVIGLQTTIRGKRMNDFLSRLVSLALPRVKDFRGIDLSNVDHGGNLNFGFKEQFSFPEIKIEESKVSFGIQVTIVPKVKNRDKAIDLYKSLGVPLKSSEGKDARKS